MADRARVETVGRIVSGRQHSDWFLYVVHDTVDTGGYFIYVNPSRDFSGEPMFDKWLPDRDGLESQFEFERWAVEWLDDPPPSFATSS